MYSVAAALNAQKQFAGRYEDGEHIENCQNEQRGLDITYTCTNIKDKVNVLWELKPVEPPKHRYGYRQKQEEPQAARSPMRIALVIDVSHSMSDAYGEDSDEVSKLDRVKLFAILLVKCLGLDDYLGIVTFGTVAKVVSPMKKMAPDVKEDAIQAIEAIVMGGVTHLSAGLFAAIELFMIDFTKSRYFDDHVIIFTDGMANEGMLETEPLVTELRRRINSVKKDCRYENDYTIKMTTLGTAGFMPELLFELGQAFSSDAYYFLGEASHLELNLIRPVVLRQVGMVSNVRIKVTALNGVMLETNDMSKEYLDREKPNDNPAVAHFIIHDMFADMQRRIICGLKLPPKHKKLLKEKDVCKMEVQYRNSQLVSDTLEKIVSYDDLPRKEIKNMEPCVIFMAKEEIRAKATKALNTAALRMKKLDRNGAKDKLQNGCASIRIYLEDMTAKVSEENHECLVAYAEPMINNLEHCDKLVGDFTVRWDDGWARLKALASSLAREVPTAAGVFIDGSEIYTSHKVNEKISDMCYRLRDIYKSHGLSTDTLENYLSVVKELEKKLQDDVLAEGNTEL